MIGLISMAPGRFVETEETFHFFNKEVVLGTNEIRSGDGSSSSSDSSDESRRVKRRRRARSSSSAVSRLAARRRSQLLSLGGISELGGTVDGFSDSEDDYDSLDEFDLEEEEEETQLRGRRNSVDAGEAETQSVTVGTKPFGVGAARYENIYEPFRDLYLPPAEPEEDAQSEILPRTSARKRRRQVQSRKARRAIATFTRRMHCANGYRYRKQSEFLRVCYLRALEGEVGREPMDATTESNQEVDAVVDLDTDSAEAQPKTPFIVASQKDGAVETTVPTLLPREWPHLPYRSPLEWQNDIDAALDFLTRLATLPERSLVYEPIDVHQFSDEAMQLIGGSSSDYPDACLSELGFAGLLGMFAVGVQMQSFSLISRAALQFIRLGQVIKVDGSETASDAHTKLVNLLNLYKTRFEKHAAEPTLAATFPRDLSAQWKVNSYQPSTSDAIATDGLYLYIFGRSGLFKIGTGNGTTVRDFVYAQNKSYARSRDAERSWLCCIGDSLYCRTIVMPGHRVDRIRTSDLNDVQELFLAPNRSLIGKAITESSVYAMVTDGVDLYTIRCIDTYKRPLHGKSSNRKHRSRSHKSRKSTPVSEIVSAVLETTSNTADPRLQSQGAGAEIQVGDRVVRGPDWKWSNQDGEKGSPGTVERISTWGGVKGSGVTVRWDKNQRVNTYRWGAEGCYDLYLVVEKDGHILERKPLPSAYRDRQTKDSEGGKGADRENEADTLPRHQFVLYRHKINLITSIMMLDEPEIDLFLDLTPSGNHHKDRSKDATRAAASETGIETLSALHSHPVVLCTSKTSWMCDGGTSNCFGDNAAKRYRCTSGCDYDLCESCLFATVIDKSPGKEDATEDEDSSIPMTGLDDKDPSAEDIIVPEVKEDSVMSGVQNEETVVECQSESPADALNPLSTIDTTLFEDSESDISAKKNVIDSSKTSKELTEEELVSDLLAFWCGVYSRKECQIALRRNGLQLNEASVWLHTCGAYLRRSMVIPTVSSVVLAPKPRSGALDPVLLIAGTFYATLGQLCVVSPPGLYNVGEGNSDKDKREASSCDASWFYSLDSGKLLADKPVLLKGIPAGSPTCVDVIRSRILVFSGYLNCLEEYVDHVRQNKHLKAPIEAMPHETLADLGKVLMVQLARLMLKRASFPAYKHPRAGLQDILFRTEREQALLSSEKPSTGGGTEGKKDGSVSKPKNRRIKNVRARLKEFARLRVIDLPGHVIPFCVDFEDEGILRIFREIAFHCKRVNGSEGTATKTDFRLVADLLRIVTETVQEFEFVGITFNLGMDNSSTRRLLRDTEVSLMGLASHCFTRKTSAEMLTADVKLQEEVSEMVLCAHFLLVWGIRKGIFCSSSRHHFFISTGKKVLSSLAPQNVVHTSSSSSILCDSYFKIMLEPHNSFVLRTECDCEVDLLRRLLYSPMDDGRIAIADFVPKQDSEFSQFLTVLFALAEMESSSSEQQKKWVGRTDELPFQTPVMKALHSVMNYCCAQIYAINMDAAPSIASAEQELVNATLTFEQFARTCFDCSLKIMGSTASDYALQTSVVGTLLPMVVAFIPNMPEFFTTKFREHLAQLMKALDNVASDPKMNDELNASSTQPGRSTSAAVFGGYQVVETPHPYNCNQSVFRRVVRIPGASLLHIEFDPRCRTKGETDIVFITSGLAWYQTDRIPYGDVGFGEDGGCFFGSYTRGNWPAGGLTIVGDTATIILCASTQSRSRSDEEDKQRWGLKCSVRGLFNSRQRNWINELGCSVANACSVIGDKLLRGPTQQGCEKVCQPWTMRKNLFNLILPGLMKDQLWKFIDGAVKRTLRDDKFWSTLAKYVHLRKLPPRYSTNMWSESLQQAAVVLLLCSNRRLLLIWFSAHADKDKTMPKDDECALFQRIALEMGKLERWMLRQVQLVSEWHYLRVDKVTFDELMERYADNKDRLSELCLLKGVTYKSDDTVGCVKCIHELLVREIEQLGVLDNGSCKKLAGSHEAVAEGVSTKACFLLKRWQKCIEYDDTSSLSAPDLHQWRSSGCLSDAGEFLRCTTSLEILEECSALHSSRLQSRLSGVAYYTDALVSLRTKDMARFFIGRVLHAIPSSDLLQDDGVFSGCTLADPSILSKMMSSLQSYSKLISDSLQMDAELPAYQASALADYWNCTYSLDNTPNRSFGLERASKLLIALDTKYDAPEMAESGVASISGDKVVKENREVHDQVKEIVWVILRLLTEEVYEDALIGEAPAEAPTTSYMENAFEELSVLYKHFGSDLEQNEDSSCFQRSHVMTSYATQAMYRLVCTMLDKLKTLHEFPEIFKCWIQNAVSLISKPGVAFYLTAAATRLVRYAVEALGDAFFELDITIDISGEGHASHQDVTFGKGIQKVLIQHIGYIMSPLPNDISNHTAQVSQRENSELCDYCVIIFSSDQAGDKIIDAAKNVEEPDISSLNIPIEVDDSEDAVEKAASEAIAECTAAVATMKHPSVRCDGCNQSPLRGFRFKCFTCPNYDLCTACYMSQTHNMDHPFVRLADSVGTGELLQARSKGGGVIPETSLVGSRSWKGNLLRVQVASQGYAIYRYGNQTECYDSANALAQLGFLVTVVHKTDVEDLESVHDWESKAQLSFEPGSSRLSHRRSSTSTEKQSVQKAGRGVINAFNTKATLVNSKTHNDGKKCEDGRPLASEIISLVRVMMSSSPILERWRGSTLRILTDILENAPRQLAISSPLDPQHEAYFLTLGATQVLGGFRELFRIGGTVLIPNYTGGKTGNSHVGVVYSYAFGNDDIVIATVDSTLDGTRSSDGILDDDVCFCKSTVSETNVVSEISLDIDAIRTLEPLAASFCSIAEQIYAWTSNSDDGESPLEDATSVSSLMRWELGCALMRSFASVIPVWPSLFDNQVISTNGNAPAILFQLAQRCVRDAKMDDIEDRRALLWKMEWLRSRAMHYSLATRPLSSSSLSACDKSTCILRPPNLSPDGSSSVQSIAGDGSGKAEETSSEYFYDLYAFSSRADLPQHSGRNKMLEYWEKNVIPAIETYVSGSFKSYEMDYFFAQLREPLREGNSAAALKIAFTLCDGHVPSGCHYPDPDTDWSALQIDDIEVGGRYVVATDNVDVSGWPQKMLWTLGHSGSARIVSPSGMVLLQVANPLTSTLEYWWYHVDSLRAATPVSSVSERSVTDFESSRLRLNTVNQQLIYCIARKCIFELLEVAPEHAMKLSIETGKTSLSRTNSSPFPLPSSSSSAHGQVKAEQLPVRPPKDMDNSYHLADLLRLAAAADLGCPDIFLSTDMTSDSSLVSAADTGSGIAFRGKTFNKSALISILQAVLNKQFERIASSPPPPVMDRSISYDENASVMVKMPSKKHKKRGKQGILAGKLAAASGGASSSGSSSSSASFSSSSGSNTSLRSIQPKLQHPEVDPAFSTRKYRYLLMESLLAELKSSLELSRTFLRSRSFTVTSDSPPEPLVLVHVPDATCLVLSFAVHPVLMDLPAGSSLEFFSDERCTDRLFGYFGDKRGLSYLPPLVIPSDKCYVRMAQGTYARYKFRVDPLTSDFGLALWICEEIYQKLLSVQLSHYEVETILTTLLNELVEYLVATSDCLPTTAKNAVYQATGKLINFALNKGAMHAVPIAKLSSLVKELTFIYDNERTTQKGLYSLYTQQLAELISLVEEVSSLKGGSSSILGSAWWKDFVRMAVFTRVLAQGKREIATPDAFKRIYCGRAPIREIEAAHQVLSSHDLFCERIIFLQNLPRTSQVVELEASVSRYLVHLSLEECGEADDQNVYSAAAVTRLGIVANVLYLPVDDEGQTTGHAIVDIGRADVIEKLLTRIPKETFEFEGGVASTEDTELLASIEAVCRPPDASTTNSEEGNTSDGSRTADKAIWACSVCTLENSLSDAECAACGSPIPPELANLSRAGSSQPAASEQATTTTDSVASTGWPCSACTFVNSWEVTSCDACTTERSADLVPPAQLSTAENDGDSQENGGRGGSKSDSCVDGNLFTLSAAKFTEMLRVADETDQVPYQVSEFLRYWLFDATKTIVGSEVDDDVDHVAVGLHNILKREVAQYCSSPASKAAVDALAALADVKTNWRWDDLPVEERLKELTSTKIISLLKMIPLRVYKWMRSSGYDLQFELNHYGSMEDALQAQEKWSHQMDCQLILACRDLSGKIGVLTLAELCPSHLSAKAHTREYSLLYALETRDLRLRFSVLRTFNKLLLAALPLVNLRPWSDPSSLRSRIVSIRQIIFPGVKIRFFAQTQDNTSLAHSVFADTNAKRPMVTIDRRRVAGKRGGVNESVSESSTLSVLRDPKKSLFASTMEQLSSIAPSLLRANRPTGASDPFVSFIVIFAGENVVGEGGPYRQLFNDISIELLTNGNPLFIPTQNNVMKAGEYRERYMPKPSSTSKEMLQMFEFVGLLMGCCLRTGVRLNLRLAPLVWKMLVKQSLVLADLESVDHSLCESLKFLEELASSPSDDPNESLYDSFTTTLSDGKIVELKSGGHSIPVTKANVKEYIRLVKATRLQECKPQVDAMLRGIGKIVPVQLLQLCVWTELQQWICGSLEIDIKLLKRHTRYSSGMTPEEFPHLETFWKVLASFSEENKRRFINFAWGQDTLPVDDAEFDRTHTRLLIKAPPQNEEINQDALLPKADTCFFNIELPVYSSEEIMREKLLLAITLCTSLDGDDQTAGRMDIYYTGDELDDEGME